MDQLSSLQWQAPMKLKSFSRLSAYARAESHLVQQTTFGAAGKASFLQHVAFCMLVHASSDMPKI